MNAGWKASHGRVFSEASSFKTQVVDGCSTRDYDDSRNRSARRPSNCGKKAEPFLYVLSHTPVTHFHPIQHRTPPSHPLAAPLLGSSPACLKSLVSRLIPPAGIRTERRGCAHLQDIKWLGFNPYHAPHYGWHRCCDNPNACFSVFRPRPDTLPSPLCHLPCGKGGNELLCIQKAISNHRVERIFFGEIIINYASWTVRLADFEIIGNFYGVCHFWLRSGKVLCYKLIWEGANPDNWSPGYTKGQQWSHWLLDCPQA